MAKVTITITDAGDEGRDHPWERRGDVSGYDG